jgi:hypothetical protein
LTVLSQTGVDSTGLNMSYTIISPAFHATPFQRQRFLRFQIDTDKGDQRIGHHLPFRIERHHLA